MQPKCLRKPARGLPRRRGVRPSRGPTDRPRYRRVFAGPRNRSERPRRRRGPHPGGGADLRRRWASGGGAASLRPARGAPRKRLTRWDSKCTHSALQSQACMAGSTQSQQVHPSPRGGHSHPHRSGPDMLTQERLAVANLGTAWDVGCLPPCVASGRPMRTGRRGTSPRPTVKRRGVEIRATRMA